MNFIRKRIRARRIALLRKRIRDEETVRIFRQIADERRRHGWK